ncbi:peptidase [Paenibacillus albicereus]|uniref:Peptidase n=1 Tax=Paenibacillus albicereus TaxID=2726185 RepID=A0A6H2GYL9_9BACL|nr:DUF1796 family putative cysteine peptidase [Paenibacillus albicereus]QJC52531.1 peptidase [Paenibacillus albicereus]
MKLKKAAGRYDLIVSLGSSCAPAIHMKRLGLRKFSMPFDWVVSLTLADVTRVLASDFQDFMLRGNLDKSPDSIFPQYYLEDGEPVLSGTGENGLAKCHLVEDRRTGFISVHDFPIVEGLPWDHAYPAYKAKLDERIARFRNELRACSHPLFIRWSAEYEEAAELEQTLAGLRAGKPFTVVILQPKSEAKDIQDCRWPLCRVAGAVVPADIQSEPLWDRVFQGISLR